MSTSTARLPHGGKEPVATKLVIVVVSLAILTFLGILSEASLNIAYSTLMEEFSISASVVQWLTAGYLLLLSVSRPQLAVHGAQVRHEDPVHHGDRDLHRRHGAGSARPVARRCDRRRVGHGGRRHAEASFCTRSLWFSRCRPGRVPRGRRITRSTTCSPMRTWTWWSG